MSDTEKWLEQRKRMISITDEACMSIQICCWADAVHKFDMVEDNPVIAIKGTRVVRTMGK